jgi:hypothetical protein
MTEMVCVRCGAHGDAVISTIDADGPVSRLYCEACWRVARYEAGPIMIEGPVVWGQDWPEMEEWLARNLRHVKDRPLPDLWHRLLAHVLREQLFHLPADVPSHVAAFLREGFQTQHES